MARTFHGGPAGIKASGAIRRIQTLTGRSRREWAEHKALSNHAWQGHLAARDAAPRLVRRPDARTEPVAIPLAVFLASTPETTREVVAVTLQPATSRPRDLNQFWQDALQAAR